MKQKNIIKKTQSKTDFRIILDIDFLREITNDQTKLVGHQPAAVPWRPQQPGDHDQAGDAVGTGQSAFPFYLYFKIIARKTIIMHNIV